MVMVAFWGKNAKSHLPAGNQNEFSFSSTRELHPDGAGTLSRWFAMLISFSINTVGIIRNRNCINTEFFLVRMEVKAVPIILSNALLQYLLDFGKKGKCEKVFYSLSGRLNYWDSLFM
jgi:hypothetical protein